MPDTNHTALLASVTLPNTGKAEALSHIEELKLLAKTMGVTVLDAVVVPIKRPQSRFLVGSGKAQELTDLAESYDVDCIIFDNELTPSQQRNWEAQTRRCVIDRHEVILEIFANSAHTKEATLQVALARMKYSLPRLTRAWTHLSRQRGGRRGTRGEGETQLEADRRVVLSRIHRLKSELERVKKQRETRRKKRTAVRIPTAAIVGYTNAGKSSLLNALTGAQVLVEDKLFATLDPTSRKLRIKNGREILLTDTVGFIRKLPHDLVDAFKSTLEETVLADLTIHVLDASDPEVLHQYRTTLNVLDEIGAGGKLSIVVFNKIDLPKAAAAIDDLKEKFPEALFVSATDNRGLDGIIQAIKALVYDATPVEKYAIPPHRFDLAALIHRTGRVLEENYHDDGIVITAQVPPKTRGVCAAYIAS
jgi:GTP-binding protein HflX